jgi:hypothetical protein
LKSIDPLNEYKREERREKDKKEKKKKERCYTRQIMTLKYEEE